MSHRSKQASILEIPLLGFNFAKFTEIEYAVPWTMSRYKTCRKEDCSRYKNHSLLFGKNIFLGYHRCLFSACMDLF